MQSPQLLQALTSNTVNGKARAIACQLEQQAVAPESGGPSISYQSAGRILVIADQPQLLQAVRELSPALQHTLLQNTSTDLTPIHEMAAIATADASSQVLRGKLVEVSGYLGQFDVLLQGDEGPLSLAAQVFSSQEHFDLLLDLCSPPQLQRDIPPPGYYAPGNDPEVLKTVLDEMSELVGVFEKPRYFVYDASICAHGRSGITGCTRCLEACPTLAIRSVGNSVEVDAHLCQGGGSCAAVCPTGAIRYVYPDTRQLLNNIRKTLHEYHVAGGVDPGLLFYGADDADALLAHAMQLPDNLFPVAVEEIGAVDMETWFTSLAYGASHIVMWSEASLPPSVLQAMREQLQHAASILTGMGYSADCLRLLDAVSCEQLIGELHGLSKQDQVFAASFTVFEDRRTNLRLALDHLHRQAPEPRAFVSLAAGAPFGEVCVDSQSCTLCMACVSQCPTGALVSGDDLPQLKFVEDKCIQCGLCARSCPEDAIGPSPRYLYAANQRLQTRVLYEEQPFCCSRCGKPFATRKMVDTMTRKLNQHWMFKGQQAALQRLQMCEDCRVKDLYEHESKIDVHQHVQP